MDKVLFGREFVKDFVSDILSQFIEGAGRALKQVAAVWLSSGSNDHIKSPLLEPSNVIKRIVLFFGNGKALRLFQWALSPLKVVNWSAARNLQFFLPRGAALKYPPSQRRGLFR